MAFDLGSALSYAGRAAPGVGKSFDEFEDRKRKQKEDELRNIGMLANLDRTQFQTEAAKQDREREESERGEGIGILSKFQSRRDSMEPLPEGQEGPVRPEESRYESAMETGLPLAAGMYKPAKELMSSISEEEKMKSGASGSVFTQKLNLLKKVGEMPEGPEKDRAFQDLMLAGATGTAYSLSDEGITRAGKKASTTEFSKIPAKIAGKEAETTVVDEFKDAESLRKEYNALSKTYKGVRDSYDRVLASAKEPSAAGDLALIFNYMKILDPGSVVRESEFANAAASGSYGDRLQAAGQKFLRGERLNDDMREDFVNRAKELYDKQKETHTKTRDQYSTLATKRGLQAEDVVGKVEEEKPGKDTHGYTVGEKRYSKKYGRELEYIGNNQWR